VQQWVKDSSPAERRWRRNSIQKPRDKCKLLIIISYGIQAKHCRKPFSNPHRGQGVMASMRQEQKRPKIWKKQKASWFEKENKNYMN
jgi:hypothetical protein